MGIEMEGARIVIQGYGNVGSWAARLAAARGARIVAISDVDGAIHDASGLDLEAIDRALVDGAYSLVETVDKAFDCMSR